MFSGLEKLAAEHLGGEAGSWRGSSGLGWEVSGSGSNLYSYQDQARFSSSQAHQQGFSGLQRTLANQQP